MTRTRVELKSRSETQQRGKKFRVERETERSFDERPFKRSRLSREVTVSSESECETPEYFWTKPEKRKMWSSDEGSIQYIALLVQPTETLAEQVSGLPLAFYFPGLDDDAEIIRDKAVEFAHVAVEPFILVSPVRKRRWWFLDDESYWGWIVGEFCSDLVALVSSWMWDLATRPGVDQARVGLFGFSCGAYAAAELLAHGGTFSGVGLGGIHGHGQVDLHEVPAKIADGVVEKYRSFLERVRAHPGAPWIEATHTKSDQMTRWVDAQPIYEALTERQVELGLPEVSVRLLDPDERDTPGNKRDKSHHNYFKAAFVRKEFLVALFGGPPPGMQLESVPPAIPTTSLNVEEYTVDMEMPDWYERAFDVFQRNGFVLVPDVLKVHQFTSVLRDCNLAAKQIVNDGRNGNRGKGRYSFGIASSSGSMLHVATFVRHLLDSATSQLRPLLDCIFEGGEKAGFQCVGSGGDFVVGETHQFQNLHSDIHVAKELNTLFPPPQLCVNFTLEELTEQNGPMRVIPGTQLEHPPPVLTDSWHCSRLCPVPAGTAIVRDVRTLHSGTPNLATRTRFLPSVEFVSADYRARGKGSVFPPTKSLSQKFFDGLQPEIQELCKELVLPKGEKLLVTYTKK